MPSLDANTPLDVLRARAAAAPRVSALVSDRLVASVQQSMRVEGHFVTSGQVRTAAARVFGTEAAK